MGGLAWGDMQPTSSGNGQATERDARAVDQNGSTTPPTATGQPPVEPIDNGPGDTMTSDVEPAGPQVDEGPAVNSAHFPPTLVAMDPPTLPAASGLAPPHRDVDNRGPADLPQFRPFPHPQRSEPGHPQLRRGWRRVLSALLGRGKR